MSSLIPPQLNGHTTIAKSALPELRPALLLKQAAVAHMRRMHSLSIHYKDSNYGVQLVNTISNESRSYCPAAQLPARHRPFFCSYLERRFNRTASCTSLDVHLQSIWKGIWARHRYSQAHCTRRSSKNCLERTQG